MIEEILKLLLGNSLKDHPITGLGVLFVVAVGWLALSAFASPIKKAVQARLPSDPVLLCRQSMTAILILHIILSYVTALWAWSFTDLAPLGSPNASQGQRAFSYFSTATFGFLPLLAYLIMAQTSSGPWPIAALSVLASWIFVAAVAISNPAATPASINPVAAFSWLYGATNLNTQAFLIAMFVAWGLGKCLWNIAGHFEREIRDRSK